jgi:hypothetical protein
MKKEICHSYLQVYWIYMFNMFNMQKKSTVMASLCPAKGEVSLVSASVHFPSPWGFQIKARLVTQSSIPTSTFTSASHLISSPRQGRLCHRRAEVSFIVYISMEPHQSQQA